MLKTKLELCQEILYEVYGGVTADQDRISEQFVLRKVNAKIAAKAVVNAYALTNLEGITYADGMFYQTYKNIPLVDDVDSGYKYFVLPAQPIGLPSNRSFTLYPPSNGDCAGMDSTMFKMIGQHEVTRLNSLPEMAKVYCWVIDGKMMVRLPRKVSKIKPTHLSLVMATADGGMTATVPLPQDVIDIITREIVKELRDIILGVPQDIKNDGVETLEPRA